MSDLGWIIVRNWEKFQHYKYRSPTWIKIYTAVLDDPEYRMLTFHRRGLLHDLWLLYAKSGSCIPLDVQLINRWIAGTAKMRDIQALVDAGFLEVSASKPLAPRYQDASPETEKSREETPLPPYGDSKSKSTRRNGQPEETTAPGGAQGRPETKAFDPRQFVVTSGYRMFSADLTDYLRDKGVAEDEIEVLVVQAENMRQIGGDP